MKVCASWLEDDYLIGAGFTLAPRPDGRRTATRDRLVYVIGPACNHTNRCPPHRPTQRLEDAA